MVVVQYDVLYCMTCDCVVTYACVVGLVFVVYPKVVVLFDL